MESEIHHPPSGQRQSGAQGCAVAEAASGKAELQAGGSVQELLLSSANWKSARRVVAKVEFHFGDLFPRVGFIVTNFRTSSRVVALLTTSAARQNNGSRKASRRSR